MFTKNHFSALVRCTLFIALIMGLLGLRPAQVALAAGNQYIASTIYVKQDAQGLNDGTSWGNAYTDLQFALAVAASGDEIWVAAGTYKPTDTGDRATSFDLPSGVRIYGGFNGTETVIDQRNPTTNISLLSGDIGIEANASDNSYHVIALESPVDPVVLDGFTVTGGNANGGAPHNRGGGIYHSGGTLSIVNTTLSSNHSVILPDVAGNGEGGAIYSTLGTLNVSMSVFSSNTASRGGAIVCNGGTLNVTDSSFNSNSATSDSNGDGGAIYSNCDSTFVNDTFSANTADHYGGAILTNNDINDVAITNSTFYGNSSLVGGGVANYGLLTVTNSTFSGNSSPDGGAVKNGLGGILSLRNSILANSVGGVDCSRSDSTPAIENINNLIETTGTNLESCGVSLLTTDPMLASLADNGGATETMALLVGSPAIGAGNNATCADTDQRGVTRPQGSYCDIGAYEETILPDLIIESITATPAQPALNQAVTFTVVVKNQGQVDSGEFYLDLFIDTALPEGCTAVGLVYAEITYLAAGASQTITLNYAAGFTSAGIHTISGLVDTECEVGESDESNNTKVVTLESSGSGVGSGIYDDRNSAWNYVGTPPWGESSLSGPYNNTLSQTGTAGSYAQVTFTGTQVKLTYLKAPGRGSFDVYIDNFTTPVTTISENNASVVWQPTWTSSTLSNTTHTIRFQSRGDGWIDMDAIQIFAPETTPPAAITLTAQTGSLNGSVNLSWTAVGDDGITGTAASYLVRYSTSPITSGNWDAATPVSVGIPTPKPAGGSESMTVTGLTPGSTYYFAVRAQDEVPNLGAVSNSPSAVAANNPGAGPGMYDGNDSRFVRLGTWTLQSLSGPYANTMNYSSNIGASATFTINGSSFVLYYTRYTNRGNIKVYDGTTLLTTINANGALAWQKTWTSPNLGPGEHIIKFVHDSGTYMDIDAIQVNAHIPAAGSGTYDGNDNRFVRLGTWTLQSLSGPYAGTMNYSSNIGASATFTMNGSSFVLYYTQFTNRGNIKVYDGTTLLTTINANGALVWQKTWTSPDLGPGEHVIKFVHDSGTYMDVDAIQVIGTDTIAPAAITNLTAQTGSLNGSVNLSWTAVGNDGTTGTAASYLVRYSTSPITSGNWGAATPATVGVPIPKPAGQAESMTVTGLTPGSTYYFAVRAQDEAPNLGAVSNSPSAVAADNPGVGPGMYDGNDSRFVRLGTWTLQSLSGPYANTMNYSSNIGASASIAINGSSFVLYYTRFTNRGNIKVYDGTTLLTTINANGALAWQKTWTSPNLGPGEHIIKFVHDSGTYMDIDAIQVNAHIPAAGSGTYDGNDNRFVRLGTWTLQSLSGPYANTMNYSSNIGASATFTINGSSFVLYYTQFTNRGNIKVYDGTTLLTTINANGALVWQKTWTSPNLGPGEHTIKFVHDSGTYMDVDAITVLP